MKRRARSLFAPPEDRQPVNLIVTAEKFFDLFLLCLSWQWGGVENAKHAWTTVDKVSRILYGLAIIGEAQRQHLFRDRKAQAIFLRHILIQHQSDRLDLKAPPQFLLFRSSSGGLNRDRLLRDARLLLTKAGAQHALGLQTKYEKVITDRTYFEEIRRQELLLADAPKEPLMENYRERVLMETNEI